jgi:hypothetical protein
MSTPTRQTASCGYKNGRSSGRVDRPKVVVIEENPLTAWAVQQTLSAVYDVVCFSTLEEAKSDLNGSDVEFVICGGSLTDDHPEWVQGLATVTGRRIIALVSDPDCSLSGPVEVLEKPFELSRLSEMIARRDKGLTMESLEDRLRMRFEKEICSVCVNQTAGRGCSLGDRRECPIFKWAPALAELIEHVASNHLSDYVDQIQAIICPGCMQDPHGTCKARDHLDCPLDLYLGLVVPIVEDELKLFKRSAG